MNAQIANFEFVSIENCNIPVISEKNVLKKKVKLRMSASEMLCFVRYLGLLIGDKVSEDNKSWKLYKYLRKIIDIVTSPRIIRSDVKVLEKLIQKHNQLYIDLFDDLKPKFHNLVHYPRILLLNGLLIHFWCMRFESCHLQLKANALSTSSRVNLLVTVATKQILKVCETIHALECESIYKFGNRSNIDSNRKKLLFHN